MRAAILATCLLTGCAHIGPGDLADAGTTAVALQHGLAEANPLVAWSGDAAPLVGLALKAWGKSVLVKLGETPAAADRDVQSMSWMGACANVATLAGATPWTALGLGLVCRAAYRKVTE